MDQRSSGDERVLIAFHGKFGREMKERELVACQASDPALVRDHLLLELTVRFYIGLVGYPKVLEKRDKSEGSFPPTSPDWWRMEIWGHNSPHLPVGTPPEMTEKDHSLVKIG